MTHRGFLEPITTRPAIDCAVDTLLDELCGTLRESGRGARRLSLLAYRGDGDVQEVAVGVAAVTCNPAHLRRLFAERLEKLEQDLGFDRMAMRATATDPLGGSQPVASLGETTPADDGGQPLSELIDRVSPARPGVTRGPNLRPLGRAAAPGAPAVATQATGCGGRSPERAPCPAAPRQSRTLGAARCEAPAARA